VSDLVLRVAAKGLIVNSNDEVLILREAGTYKDGTQLGKWGLPGGRINIGEVYRAGLIREVREETSLDIEPQNPIYVGEWRPVIKGAPHQIIAIFTVCKTRSTTIRLSDEHDKFAWVSMVSLDDYPVLMPDHDVIKEYYAQH
jgi:8-oxo-dGTP diphosphatase